MDWFRQTLLSGWRKPNLLTYALLPLSLLYLLIIKIRQLAYRLHLFGSKKLSGAGYSYW